MLRKESAKKQFREMILVEGEKGYREFLLLKSCRNNLCVHIILPKLSSKGWAQKFIKELNMSLKVSSV